MRKLNSKPLLQFALTTLFCSTFSTAVSANGIKILPIGDSITQGTKGEQSYRKPLIQELDLIGCNYEMVGSRLQTNRPQLEPSPVFESPHEGYSAHATNDFTEGTFSNQVQNPGIDNIMDAEDPDVILVHLGSNDMDRSHPITGPYQSDGLGGTISEIDLLATKIWNKNPNAEILVANVIPWFGGSSNPNIGADVEDLGDEIEAWVTNENDSRLHLVDVRSNYLSSYMNADGIHPNQNGDAHIADAFLQVIEDNSLCPEGFPPGTFISSPSVAGELLPLTHTFTGTATDQGGSGFDRVRVAIEDDNHTDNSDRWYNFSSGTFGSFDSKNATLMNVTTASLDWEVTATMPGGGSYTIYALAIDNNGNQDYDGPPALWRTNRQFFVNADQGSPISTIAKPNTENAIIYTGTYNFSGSATDTGGSGFDTVEIAIRSRSADRWYNFSNNSLSGAIGNGAVPANLTNTTLTSTNWNRIASLPVGQYTLAIRTTDNAGNSSAWAYRRFIVQAPDTNNPVSTIATPNTENAIISTGNYNFSGSATDTGGSGFDTVEIAIRSRSASQWYNFSNNSLSGAIGNGAVPANLTNATLTSTNWNRIASLPVGQYTLAIRTTDNAGNSSAWTYRRFIVQAPDTNNPVSIIATPNTENAIISTGTYNFSGSATDTGGSGFDTVEIAIRSRSADRWYNFSNNSLSGAIGNGAVPANLTNTTLTSTNWNRIASLPVGQYTLAIRTTDNAGNSSAWTYRRFIVQAPDTNNPVSIIATPNTENAIISTGTYNFSGSATDTGGSGFDTVEIAIRSRSASQWYNFSNNSLSGAIGNGAVPANLTNATLTSTNWNRIASLPVGQYTLAIRTTDNAGNSSAWTYRRFIVQAPDTNNPVSTIATPNTENAIISTGNYNFSGSATDTGGSGFDTVEIAIRSRSASQWYNFSNNSLSGAIGNGAVPANLTNATLTSTNWNRIASLPVGQYTLAIRTTDNAGNSSAWTYRRFVIQ